MQTFVHIHWDLAVCDLTTGHLLKQSPARAGPVTLKHIDISL